MLVNDQRKLPRCVGSLTSYADMHPAIKLFDDLVKHQSGCQDGTHYLVRRHPRHPNVGGATRAVLRAVLGSHRIIDCFGTDADVELWPSPGALIEIQLLKSSHWSVPAPGPMQTSATTFSGSPYQKPKHSIKPWQSLHSPIQRTQLLAGVNSPVS